MGRAVAPGPGPAGRPGGAGAIHRGFGHLIDRAADLAARVEGDGEALVRALRAGELGRFRTRKIDELERWLADEGYTDDQERLTGEDRRRLTLQRIAAATDADAADVNRVVSWMEAGTAAGEGAGNRGGQFHEDFGIEREPA